MWPYILLLPRCTEQILVELRFTDTVITDIFPCPREKASPHNSSTLFNSLNADNALLRTLTTDPQCPYDIDLARAKSEALDNIYSLFK